MPALVSIPTILDVDVIRGTRATEAAPLDLVFEIPHGATRTEDFTSLAARLTSPLPDGLVDFFHVNTDAGAPELAVATARRFVEAEPARSVAILRCRIPRTLIDCNRRVDASPEDFKAGKVSPGLMPWITAPEDRAMLRAAYDRYVAAVKDASTHIAQDDQAYGLLCGWISAILEGRHQRQDDLVAYVEENLSLVATSLRDAADVYEEMEAGTADTMTGISNNLGGLR